MNTVANAVNNSIKFNYVMSIFIVINTTTAIDTILGLLLWKDYLEMGS